MPLSVDQKSGWPHSRRGQRYGHGQSLPQSAASVYLPPGYCALSYSHGMSWERIKILGKRPKVCKMIQDYFQKPGRPKLHHDSDGGMLHLPVWSMVSSAWCYHMLPTMPLLSCLPLDWYPILGSSWPHWNFYPCPSCPSCWHHVAPCGTSCSHSSKAKTLFLCLPRSRGSRGSQGRHVSRWLIHIDPSQLSSGQHDVPHRLQGRADPGVLQKSSGITVVFSHQPSSPQQEVSIVNISQLISGPMACLTVWYCLKIYNLSTGDLYWFKKCNWTFLS